jgi:hypothetical protein
MPMRPRLLPLLALTLAACGESPAREAPAPQALRSQTAAAQAAPAQREGILLSIFEADGSYMVEPIAIITPGGLRDPWSIESDSAFIGRYFAPGTRYAVRVAGLPSGDARVLGMPEPGCNERIASTSFMGSAALPAQWEGLASDAFGPPAAGALMRPLTAEEQSELATLADSIHASHRIPSAARAAGESDRLFAVMVPGAEAPVLVGTFNVAVPDGENTQTYNQMLIAERHSGVYRPAYVHHIRDDGETGVRSLFEAADLDGDGAPELVVRLMFTEGWGFAVLRRGADGWTEIYQGGGGGC